MRSMVEGYAQSGAAYDLAYPSTTLRVVPLPLGGGPLQAAIGRLQTLQVTILPVPQAWGGGPPRSGGGGAATSAQKPLRQRFALPPPHGFATGRILQAQSPLAAPPPPAKPLSYKAGPR